jgi:acetyltransferase-like isoleucine patch superfamily enzyme
MLLKIQTIAAKVLKKMRLSALNGSQIHPSAKVEAGSSLYHSCMGKYSFCGYDCDIYLANIGCFTSIASHVVIGGARHPMEWVGMSPVFYEGRDSIRKKFSNHAPGVPKMTTVGHDVWIGHSAIILSGVTIGDGSIVGAGSVVTKDVPPYAVVAGNPAKLVRSRFDEETKGLLLKMRWWELDEEILHKLAKHVRDPLQFIGAYNELINS